MTWLGGKRIAAAVIEALNLEKGNAVLVGFDAKLAARLEAAGMNVTFTTDIERDLSRATTKAIPYSSQLASDETFVAAVTIGAAARPEGGDAVVSSVMKVVATRGRVALVDRVARPAASRAALLGGLSQLEQTTAGRYVITTGEVVTL